MPFPAQCVYAAKLGLRRLEIAPYTLSDEPHRWAAPSSPRRAPRPPTLGIAITGCTGCWSSRRGLSISTRDDAVRRRSIEVMLALIDQCAELGGRYLVHGSPHSGASSLARRARPALARGAGQLCGSAERAEKAGVVYCIEALSRADAAHQHAGRGRPHREGHRQHVNQEHARLQRRGRMEKQPLAHWSSAGCRGRDRAPCS